VSVYRCRDKRNATSHKSPAPASAENILAHSHKPNASTSAEDVGRRPRAAIASLIRAKSPVNHLHHNAPDASPYHSLPTAQKNSGLAVTRGEIIHRTYIRGNGESSHRVDPNEPIPLLPTPSIAAQAYRRFAPLHYLGGRPHSPRERSRLRGQFWRSARRRHRGASCCQGSPCAGRSGRPAASNCAAGSDQTVCRQRSS